MPRHFVFPYLRRRFFSSASPHMDDVPLLFDMHLPDDDVPPPRDVPLPSEAWHLIADGDVFAVESPADRCIDSGLAARRAEADSTACRTQVRDGHAVYTKQGTSRRGSQAHADAGVAASQRPCQRRPAPNAESPRQSAQGQIRHFRWQVLGEIKRKEKKRENGRENKRHMFWLLYLQKQLLG